MDNINKSNTRRSVLKGMAAAGAGTSVALGSTGTAAAGSFKGCDSDDWNPDWSTPHISTAHHFDTSWGSVSTTDSWEDHYHYDTYGGYDYWRDDVTMIFHGWKNDWTCGLGKYEYAKQRFDWLGSLIDTSPAGWCWDSDYSWGNSKEIAERNASKIAMWAYYQNARGNKVRLMGHSMGGYIICEAIWMLDHWGWDDIVDSVILLAAAVDNDDVSYDGRYGYALARAAGHVENFYDRNDSVLSYAYRTRELSRAVGYSGASGTTPWNYTDHEMTGEREEHDFTHWMEWPHIYYDYLPTYQ